MAYNGRYISIRSVVEKAYRDAGLEKVDWESAVEWTIDFMGAIGIPHQYITKDTNGVGDNIDPIMINDYRGILPVELVDIISCRRVQLDDNGKIINVHPMIEVMDLYHETQDGPHSSAGLVYSPSETTVFRTELDEYEDPEEVQYRINTDEASVNQNEFVFGRSTPYGYKIQGSYIMTDFEDGYIEVVFKSYPVDNTGFPMIPEDPKYLRALEYHIISMVDWKIWRASPSPQNKSILNDSEQKAAWAIGSARTKAHIPSIDQMESLKNMWLRSIPKPNEHANGFKTVDTPEMRYNQQIVRKR